VPFADSIQLYCTWGLTLLNSPCLEEEACELSFATPDGPGPLFELWAEFFCSACDFRFRLRDLAVREFDPCLATGAEADATDCGRTAAECIISNGDELFELVTAVSLTETATAVDVAGLAAIEIPFEMVAKNRSICSGVIDNCVGLSLVG